MPENIHEFEQGEQYNGVTDSEEIIIRDVQTHTVVWDLIVNGDTLSRNTTEKDTARTFVQTGYWAPLS